MPTPTFTAPPAAPSRMNPTGFPAAAEAMMGWMPTNVAEMTVAVTWMNDTANTVAGQAAAAAGAIGAIAWVSGTTYALYDVRVSPITFFAYRRKVAGGGTTDPSLDTTNWAQIAGTGDVTLTGSQTLTNKTLTSPTLTGPVIDGTITEDIYTITDGGSVDINPANGSIQLWTLGANRTPTASSFAAGKAVTLMIADGTAYSITWSSVAVTWVGGSAPALPTTGYGVIILWKVGSTIYGASAGDVA
ncbi:hypothetical protein [Rhizorhabdus sp.]|uniref:hypothetical protein n=1 Tax=Rhizorhabdus sp. TaxID=1968843 RepID=UPI0019AF7462|nr:hypothetical protein [Rhizorhabdus sp.]MBD3762473.1 hypothetical protein [Rhizorhabdus sp.]